MLGNPLLLSDDGYNISRSVRLRSSASAYFNRTPAGAGNRRTWTWSGWVKRGTLGVASRIFAADDGSASTDQDYNTLLFNSSDQLQFSGNLTNFRISTAVYRDPSAWYHIVFVVDTTQATAGNRFKLYVNGSEVTAFGTSNNPTQNTDLAVNAAIGHYIGSIAGASYVDAYLTEVNFIDGQALTPSSFGETDAVTGVWKPKKYGGTYGTNGFYLNFSDNSNNTATTIGKDYSGNGNNWTPNNISVTSGVTYDSMLDVPTQWADGGNGRGNYCVLNPLQTTQSASAPTNGNLTSPANTGVWRRIGASMQMPTSGKFYFEYTCDSFSSFATFNIGVFSGNIDTANNAIGAVSTEWGYNAQSGYASNNSANISTGFTTATTGDVLQLAYDASTGSLWFGKNNTWQGASSPNPATGTSPTYTGVYNVTPVMIQNWATQSANFGQRPFAYTPPTGFKALNTQNFPAPTILNGNQYFDVTLRTTVGGTGGSISSLSFEPDFLWTKLRNTTSGNVLWDSERGVANYLVSNTTAAQTSASTWLTSFNSNGYTYGTGDFGAGNSAVDWAWKESATAGFDIVTYTGTGANRTVAHSLGVAPRMMIVKRRSGIDSWPVYHANLTSAANTLILNSTAAQQTIATYWNSTAPTSSVFSIGTDSAVNANAETYVAYLFAEVAGFSRFGSYTGNGSSDGAFVYCGFRPRWVMIKNATSSSANTGWYIFDAARNTVNTLSNPLRSELSDAESSGYAIDFLSNGFKLRISDAGINSGAGSTHIFAAFAENPFKNALAR